MTVFSLGFLTICFAIMLIALLMGCLERAIIEGKRASGKDVLAVAVCTVLFMVGLFLTIARIVG